MTNARSKGAGGEREFCNYLKMHFGVNAERNLEQVRDGGTDIICPPFGFEVKRREDLDLKSWWIQAKNDCEKYNNPYFDLIPVVAFRQNGKPWEFLVSAKFIGCQLGFIRINEDVFKEFVQRGLYSLEHKPANNELPDYSKVWEEAGGVCAHAIEYKPNHGD